MTRKPLLLVIVALLLSQLAFAQPQTAEPVTTVFLVRHAERADEPRQDPPLTEKGTARSQELARLLSNAGIKAIYTSQFARTKLTGEPLAKQLGITPTALSLKLNPSNPRQIAEESTKETVDKILSHAGGQCACHRSQQLDSRRDQDARRRRHTHDRRKAVRQSVYRDRLREGQS